MHLARVNPQSAGFVYPQLQIFSPAGAVQWLICVFTSYWAKSKVVVSDGRESFIYSVGNGMRIILDDLK